MLCVMQTWYASASRNQQLPISVLWFEPEKTSDRLQKDESFSNAQHFCASSQRSIVLYVATSFAKRCGPAACSIAWTFGACTHVIQSNRSFGIGMAIPRTGLVWKRRLMQSSTNAMRPAATTTLRIVSMAVSVILTETEPTLRFHCDFQGSLSRLYPWCNVESSPL